MGKNAHGKELIEISKDRYNILSQIKYIVATELNRKISFNDAFSIYLYLGNGTEYANIEEYVKEIDKTESLNIETLENRD